MAGHFKGFSHTDGYKVKTCRTRRELILTHIQLKTVLLLKVTLALTVTKKMTLLTQTPHSGLTLHTVNLLYFYYYYFQPNCKSEEMTHIIGMRDK